MPIIGAVLLLPEPLDEPLLQRLRTDPRVTLGDPIGPRVPIVLDSIDKRADRTFWEALQADPTILHIEFAFAEFSDLTTPATARTAT